MIQPASLSANPLNRDQNDQIYIGYVLLTNRNTGEQGISN